MSQILENLQSTVIFSETDITNVESYITTHYSTFSDEDTHKIMIHYLQQKMERDFSCFDPKYIGYVRSRLIQNVLGRRPYRIMAIDILKACMQLNVQFDDFYTGLRKWIFSLNCAAVSEDDIDRFIAQLRRLMRDHPELSFDELIQTKKHLFANTESVSLTVPIPTESFSRAKSESFSSTVKLFLDELDWNPLEADEPAPPKRLFTATKMILAGIAGLLLSAATGIWLTLSFDKEPARRVASHPWNQHAVAQAQPTKETSLSRDENTLPVRIGANNIVNRSRTLVRSTPLPDTTELEKKPEKSDKLPEIKSVIIDYEEVSKDGIVSKVPVSHNFSKKLVTRVRIYSGSSDNNATGNEDLGDDKSPDKAKETAKIKTVVAESDTLTPGSRVYLKFPQEYRYLNGVYFTETPDAANGDIQISIASKDDHPVKEGMVPTFDCDQVEVYVLDTSE
jgi:hypothetical protein